MKTLMIRDEVYKKLKAIKKEKESFSDLLERLVESVDNKIKLEKFFGILSEEEAEKLELETTEVRTRLSRGMEKRLDKSTKRLKDKGNR